MALSSKTRCYNSKSIRPSDQFPVLSVAGGLHGLHLPHSHHGLLYGLPLLVPHDSLHPGVDLQEEVQHGVLVVSPILTIILISDVMIIIVLVMFDTNDHTRPFIRDVK